jgi:hypothetical protein
MHLLRSRTLSDDVAGSSLALDMEWNVFVELQRERWVVGGALFSRGLKNVFWVEAFLVLLIL